MWPGCTACSDAFSTDQSLLDMLEADYASHPLSKKWAITYINGALFESYNRLLQQKKIDAIYLTNRQDVFDFLDPTRTCPCSSKSWKPWVSTTRTSWAGFNRIPWRTIF